VALLTIAIGRMAPAEN